jgi:hypothetical protein
MTYNHVDIWLKMFLCPLFFLILYLLHIIHFNIKFLILHKDTIKNYVYEKNYTNILLLC